jgi:flagellar basal body P-ring formation protein FlgA
MRWRTLLLMPAAALLVGVGAAPLAAQGGVPIAARDLPRGTVLSEADIAFRDAGGRRTGEAAEAGWVTRRVVRAGEELRTPAVARPEAVRSGDEVTVRVRQGTVLLTLRGVAAAGAGIGETVWVRIGTGWRIQGVVAGPGEVAIKAPQGIK